MSTSPPNNGVHPTRIQRAFILNVPGALVMPGIGRKRPKGPHDKSRDFRPLTLFHRKRPTVMTL
jgi:hypothetical protein